MSNLPDGVYSSGSPAPDPNRPGTNFPQVSADGAFDPTGDREFQAAHSKSDVDSGNRAQHHTLGRGAFQAMPGNIIDSIAPVGEIIMGLSLTPPKGFLVCQGQTLSRTRYSQLYKYANDNGLIGSTANFAFGPGDGATTFTIIDARMRLPLGYSTGVLPGRTDVIASQTDRATAFGKDHGHSYPGGALNTGSNRDISNPVIISVDAGGDHGHNATIGGAHVHDVAGAGFHTHSIDAPTGGNTSGSGTAVNVAAAGHNHGGSTGNGSAHTHSTLADSHSHSVDSPGSTHSHTASENATGHKHPIDTTFLSSLGMVNPVSNYPPYFTVVFYIRYTNKLDFEGAPLT